MRLPSNRLVIVRGVLHSEWKTAWVNNRVIIFLSVNAEAQSMRDDTQIKAADFITVQKKH